MTVRGRVERGDAHFARTHAHPHTPAGTRTSSHTHARIGAGRTLTGASVGLTEKSYTGDDADVDTGSARAHGGAHETIREGARVDKFALRMAAVRRAGFRTLML